MIRILDIDDGFYYPKFITFSGGEEHVNIDSLHNIVKDNTVTILANLTSSIEIMRLLMVTDAIRRCDRELRIDLHIPYLPYARQDRVCVNGDAFGLKVFCDIINGQKYNTVTISDVHSIVCLALLDNCIHLPQDYFLSGVASRIADEVDYIVAPDVGASKKCELWVNKWNSLSYEHKDVELIQALKTRDKFGNIIETKLLCADLTDKVCLIVDDICDGGRTFFELSKLLKVKGVKAVYLYVTHAIVSQGINAIGVDKLFTTDSFDEKDDGRIIVHRFFN